MPSRLRTLAPLALGLALLAASAALNLRLAAQQRLRPYDVAHVPAGPAARVAALGQRGLVSDLYWLAAVQYIGEAKADQRGWEKLLPLIDLVTDLDPRHGYAYQTGGIVLSAVGRLDESDAILQKGMTVGPSWWSYPYYLAFNAWFYRGDYADGARWAQIAARTPGASPNISHLAVSLSSKNGTPEQAITLLEELRATVKDESTAAKLDEQLKLALLERDAQALERAMAEYRARSGAAPTSLDQLVASGLLPALPRDPFGGTYRIDPADGKVHSSANAFRFKPQEHRGRHHGLQYKPPGSSPGKKETP